MKWFDVKFVGDYFSLHTVVIVDEEQTEDDAIRHAAQNIQQHYGWDVLDAANVEVEAILK